LIIGHKIFGKGSEKVIVLHGWLADYSVFEPMFPALDAEKFTYAFIDYRGYGLSKEIAGKHTMEEIGQDALGLADHLGWSRFHVIGHSMGGKAVQWLAAKATDRVKSGIAVTPAPACAVPLEPEALPIFENAADIPKNRGMIVMQSSGNRHSAAWERWMIERSLATTTRDAFADYFVAWSKEDFVSMVQGVRTPIKVLAGEYDPHLTPEVMQQTILQWFPNAELEVLRNSGHYPMIEIPINLATICDNFMWSHR
jgi:pimeloyl-ACP methyl ester carboxylesterase